MQDTVGWSSSQQMRLRELNVNKTVMENQFYNAFERDKQFQELEKMYVSSLRKELSDFQINIRRPRIELLRESLIGLLLSEGFVQVRTPLIISRTSLEKMSIVQSHPLFNQVYWVSSRQCLRPMLASGLYAMLPDLLRLWEHPVRLFEVGPCFRKEKGGSKHASEFTMLNLVEMGIDGNTCEQRMEYLVETIMKDNGLEEYSLVEQDSIVYGTTLDVLVEGIEVASGAIGPHPLDEAWRINVPWMGIGFGLERLLMVREKNFSVNPWKRSVSYLDGISLKI
jgi:phenylalanyl-tRNA synthetase alpha chain